MFTWIKKLIASPDNESNAIDKVVDTKQAPSVSLTKKGDECMANGDFPAAILCYRDAIAQNSKDAAAYCGLAYALKEVGNINEAEAVALQALAIDANQIDAHQLLATLFQEGGQILQALLHYQKIVDINPGNASAYLPLAFLLFQQNKLDRAAELLTSGLERCGESADLHFFLGNIEHSRGKISPAILNFERAASLQPQRAEIQANLGLALLQSGSATRAIEVLREAWRLNPAQADVAINLGNALQQQADFDAAIAIYQQGLLVAPHSTALHCNLGLVLQKQQQYVAAIQQFALALTIEPDNVEALFNFGNVLQEQENLSEAITLFNRAVAVAPTHIAAINNLGSALRSIGEFEAALTCYENILQLDNQHVDAYKNMAATLLALKRDDEALASLENALRSAPQNAQIELTLARLLKDFGRIDDAIFHVKHVIELAPDHAEAHGTLGDMVFAQGKLREAESSFREAIRLDPNLIQAYCNLGVTLHKLQRIEEAIAIYRLALENDTDNVNVLSHLGHALKDAKQYEQAISAIQRALKIQPDFNGGNSLLADVQLAYGKLEDAAASYRNELALHPESLDARSAYLFMLNFFADIPALTALAEAQRFGELATQRARPFQQWHGATDPNRQLRIGLVSGDFRNHPVGHFLENMLDSLVSICEGSLHLTAYSNHIDSDAITAHIRSRCDEWRDVHAMTDQQLAACIHEDATDILIDLSGHTANYRLPVFAWKPAPVQATWLGYFGTTGVEQIDYFIADPSSVPIGNASQFSEKIWRLPDTRFVFTAPNADVPVSALPALQNGYLTFGCFNNLSKMTDQVVALWASILQRIPSSRLFLKSTQLGNPQVQEDVRARFAVHGIETHRLILEGFSSRTSYLATYHQIDIALDPFPYTGGTTTVESLWMGVPVFTLTGERLIARQGTSLLMNAGLPDWVADSEEEYVEAVVKHTENLEQLAQLRARLRNQVLHSPLFDANRFARQFETALREMWKKHCGQVQAS